jgi:hypothetical protein
MIDFSRQMTLTGLKSPSTATVIGTGAVGCWSSLYLAMAGVPYLRIYTLGNVKASDILRFPFRPEESDLPYANCLGACLKSIRPDVELDFRGKFEPGDDVVGTVVNAAASELDNFDSQLFAQVKSQGQNYMTGFYSEHIIAVTNFHRDDHPKATLDPVPVWAGNASSVGMHIAQQTMFPREEEFEWAMDLRRPDLTIGNDWSAMGPSRPAR